MSPQYLILNDTKIRQVGNSYVITIPKDLIKYKIINPFKKYRIKILLGYKKEVKKK